MGAWIEISCTFRKMTVFWSHPTMGAWIEITILALWACKKYRSHPTMGAWIEIALRQVSVAYC